MSSFGRALPSIALIGFFIAWLGVGFWNIAVALVVLGIPPILTNAYFAVDGVDRDVVEAARGMGLTEPQILTRVELPLGLPLLIAGVRIAAVFVIATSTIAGIAGGGGLGDDHRRPGRPTASPACSPRRSASSALALLHGWRARTRRARGLAPDGAEGVGSSGKGKPRRRTRWFGSTRGALPRRRSRSRSGSRF